MGLLRFLFGPKKIEEPHDNPIHYTGKSREIAFEGIRGTSYEVINRQTGETYWTGQEPPHFPTPRYFASFGVINNLKREHKYEEAYAAAWEALQLLPLVAERWHKRFNMEFGAASVPPLEYIADHLIMTRDKARLEEVKAILANPIELQHFYGVIDYASERMELFERILTYMKAQPGCLQNSLGKALGIDGRAAASLMAQAEARELVKRERFNSTYKLYLFQGSKDNASL